MTTVLKLTKRERDAVDSYLETAAVAVAPPAPPSHARRRPAPPPNGDATRAALKRGPGDAARAALPAFQHRAAILATIDAHAVTILRGATGCGKSTQVPRLIVEALAARGAAHARVVVCEPRRLAATALAARVAEETGQRVGGLVGYSVRGESKRAPTTAVEYCTTGLVLRRLQEPGALAHITHVIVDEVHERSADCDLLLLFLRRLANASKIVLMSATVDAAPLRAYFGNDAAVIDVPGRAFPVAVKYLEDAVRALPAFDVALGGAGARAAPRPDAPSATPARAVVDAATEAEAAAAAAAAATAAGAATLVAHAAKLRRAADAFPWAACGRAGDDWLEGLGAAGARAALGRAGAVLRKLDLGARVNEPLVAALAARLSAEDGAVLVFVPGVREIDSLCAALERHPKLHAVPLHGRLSVAEQSRAFRPAPPGRTKVVVATDVAEASITIPDCTNVIDCGLARSLVGEAWSARAARRIITSRVSADAAKQRAGRAGRVRAGTCWRLWCAVEQDALDAARPPEMSTAPLCGVALRARALFAGAGRVAALLAACPAPPPPDRAAAAIRELAEMGALDRETEALTPLGAALAGLPTDPAAGCALLVGSLLGVGEAVAVAVAAAEAPRDPLDAPSKRLLERRSDALAVVRAVAEKAPSADGRALRNVIREAGRLAAAARAARRGGGDAADLAKADGALVAAALLAADPPLLRVEAGGARPRLTFIDDSGAGRAARPHPSCGFADFESGALVVANGGLVRAAAGAAEASARGLAAAPPLAALVFCSVATPLVAAEPADEGRVRALRARVRAVMWGGDDPALQNLCATLFERWRPAWSALPDGWSVEEDEAGTPVWRADAVFGLEARRTRPTATAAAAAEEKREGRRAVAAFEADLAARRPPPAAAAAAAAATPVDTAARALKKEREVAAAGRAAKADDLARAEASRAARADDLARAEAMVREERTAAARGGAAGRCAGGVAALLKRLELDQYVEPFAKAGVTDSALAELAATIDADKTEGATAVDALIAKVPVRGGSGMRLRKALLEKEGGRGRGGGAGRGRGRGKGAPAPKPAKPKKKKPKDDGAMLAATLAEGSGKKKKKKR